MLGKLELSIGNRKIMLKSKVKDLKLKLAYHKYEKKNLVNKFICINILNKRTNLFCFFVKKMRDKQGSKISVTRRCILNNRSRGVSRFFGLSRICLRELLRFGQIPGFKKAVW